MDPIWDPPLLVLKYKASFERFFRLAYSPALARLDGLDEVVLSNEAQRRLFKHRDGMMSGERRCLVFSLPLSAGGAFLKKISCPSHLCPRERLRRAAPRGRSRTSGRRQVRGRRNARFQVVTIPFLLGRVLFLGAFLFGSRLGHAGLARIPLGGVLVARGGGLVRQLLLAEGLLPVLRRIGLHDAAAGQEQAGGRHR
jgi:hypothetical protein